MSFPLLASWRRESAYYTYLYCQFLIGVPYFIFNTYVLYQIQVVGFLIGTDVDGQPCTTYCIVPWGGTRLDLNTVLLYMNALGFPLGGALMIILSAYSDFWDQKHLLITICFVLTGALSIPVYWLQHFTVSDFQYLSGIAITFGIATMITGSLLNVYVPYCMRNADAANTGTDLLHDAPMKRIGNEDNTRGRSYGFVMSILGSVTNYVGSILMLVLGIILSRTLSGNAAQTAGLLITTIVGFLTVVGSAVAYRGFPPIPARPRSKGNWFRPILELFKPFNDLVVRKNMSALLVSYTVYTDCTIAISSVVSQLFLAEIHPSALEWSLYSLAASLTGLLCPLIFLWIRPWVKVRLETWLLGGYILILVIPVWGCVGLANVDLGFKVWVNYVASGPLQNSTHELRFPIVISLVFLIVSIVVEICRGTLSAFEIDRKRWKCVDKATFANSTASTITDRGSKESVDICNKA
ncbi:hypothetical protein H2200_006772 [Cladophialophora chaetospira]|uniref:Autophagy-related protein n=1 Tax=Cladophialophora chaetospira TaxID=386627 RepID=A0AA38X8U7_9EURO|nr:hypothetical protein H2200_006772 [Cladophialophora chaetospira]